MGQTQDKPQHDSDVEGELMRGGEGDQSVNPSPPKHSGKKKKHRAKKSKDPIMTPPKVEITEPMEEPRIVSKVEAKKPLSPKQEKIETNIDDILDEPEAPKETINGSETDKENISSMKTPVKQQIHEKHIEVAEQTTPPQTNLDNMPAPNATSTPAVNGVNGAVVAYNLDEDESESEEESDESDDGSSDEERTCKFGTLSGVSCLAWMSGSQESSTSHHRSLPDYGKFYKSSYLKDNCQNYMKRPTGSTSRIPPVKNFSRPENFTYSKEPPSWAKKSGMMAMASGTGTKVVKVRSTSPVQPDLKNAEVLRMSTYPAAKPPPPNEVTKIEREDWPGPPSPASLLPELMRERKRNRGEPLYDDEEIEVTPQVDPKVLREIDELSKFEDKSSITQAILKQLKDRKMVIPVPLDPWKASRAPSAKYEPKMQTRHLSPMFASPSRFLDRPRPRSWDDNDIGYRSLCIPHYTKYPEAKPGYGRWQAKSATLPLSGQYGGHLDFSYFEYEDQDHSKEKSAHTSTSTVNTESSSKREHPSSIFEGTGPSVSLLRIQQGSWHTATVPLVYDYDRLKITNFDLPKDVDRNTLEIHLSKEEFESIFKMTREEFYKLAEWKRNDMKRRHHLY